MAGGPEIILISGEAFRPVCIWRDAFKRRYYRPICTDLLTRDLAAVFAGHHPHGPLDDSYVRAAAGRALRWTSGAWSRAAVRLAWLRRDPLFGRLERWARGNRDAGHALAVRLDVRAFPALECAHTIELDQVRAQCRRTDAARFCQLGQIGRPVAIGL